MPEFLKKIIQWNYSRGTWQYDAFCLLIVAFIFLTPKIWFDKREKLATQTARLIVKPEDFSSDKGEMDKRVKRWSGNPEAELLDWRKKRDERGNVFYEIDIR